MVEAVATFPAVKDPFKEILEREDVRLAKSLSEQDALILRHLRGEETVVFDASRINSFEAHQYRAQRVLGKVRARKNKQRERQRIARTEALQRIDSQGYSFRQLIKPNKI